MKKIVTLEQISVEELISLTADAVAGRLKNLLPKTENQESYLTSKQAAKLLQISLPTLHKYCKNEQIPSHRLGGRILFRRSELDKIVNEGLRYSLKKGCAL